MPSALVDFGGVGSEAWSWQYALADISNMLRSKKQNAIGLSLSFSLSASFRKVSTFDRFGPKSFNVRKDLLTERSSLVAVVAGFPVGEEPGDGFAPLGTPLFPAPPLVVLEEPLPD